jgi:phage tail-like protein
MAEKRKDLNVIDSRSTIQTDPMRAFRFRATFRSAGAFPFNSAITSFSGGFNSVSGLNTTVTPITYREGGYNTTMHQIPGMATFSPVVFSRGALYGNDSAITWMRGLFAATSGEGFAISNTNNARNFRCRVTIEAMDHPNAGISTNIPRIGFYLHNAWISTLAFSDLNAGANELMFEQMTLVHEGLSVAMLNSNGTAATGNFKPPGFA